MHVWLGSGVQVQRSLTLTVRSGFKLCGSFRCEDILRVDATPFEGFEETVQIYESLEKCLRIKKEWFAFLADVGEEAFWQADIEKIQTAAQVWRASTTTAAVSQSVTDMAESNQALKPRQLKHIGTECSENKQKV